MGRTSAVDGACGHTSQGGKRRVRRHLLARLLAGAFLALWPQAAPAEMFQSWQELTPEQRKRALENYRLFQRLDPDRREDVERNYERWRLLPEPQKERLRQNFERYQEMSPDERREFDRRFRQLRRRR